MVVAKSYVKIPTPKKKILKPATALIAINNLLPFRLKSTMADKSGICIMPYGGCPCIYTVYYSMPLQVKFGQPDKEERRKDMSHSVYGR
jgi:hypothetical protein